MLKDYLIALSLVNLWFVDVWRLFLIRHFTSFPYYHWKANPAPILLATMLDILLLSAMLWLALTLARRSRRILAIARSVFVVVFVLLAANLLLIAIRNPPLRPLFYNLMQRPQLLFNLQGITTIYSWFAVVGLLAGWVGIAMMIHSLIYRRQQLIKLSATILLITSPFVLVTFTQAAAQWIGYRSGEQFRESTATALSQNRNSGRRILWLIFDELDFRLSFIDRPATLELPECDRLRNESVFAANAYPPGGDTEISLPALINGRLVSEIERTAPNELMITYVDSRPSRLWSTEPNVFSRVKAMDLNAGLAGWYHPYCRVIGSSLTQCSWETAGILFLANAEIADLISYSERVSVTQSMVRLARIVLIPKMIRLLIPGDEASVWRRYYVRAFNNIHQHALEMAVDPDLQVIMVHYPIPHPPGIYDRKKHHFSLSSSSGYLDNLVLVDRVLEQLRQKMEQAGVWERTTMVISSDHRLRADRVWKDHPLWQPSVTKEDPLVRNSKSDERVPFILKLAGESEGLNYEPVFNTVLSQDLLLAVLSGEVSRNRDVVSWLDRHLSIGESPSVQPEK